jgi:hypothetical protein
VAKQEQSVQNRTKAELRSAGFKFSDRTFASLWGEIQHATSLRGDIAAANVNRRPLAAERSPITGGKIGEYLYRFDVLLRRKGEREVLRTHVGVKSRGLITYNDAAMQMLEKFIANEDQYQSFVLDWIPAAVNEFTG